MVILNCKVLSFPQSARSGPLRGKEKRESHFDLLFSLSSIWASLRYAQQAALNLKNWACPA